MIELFLIAAALSMDTFAVALCLGSKMRDRTMKGPVTLGLWFASFSMLMPLIGFCTASLFADDIEAFGHWIVFGLLTFLGVRMIIGSLNKDDDARETSLAPSKILPYAVATSIDALAIGASFAILETEIIPAVAMIGAVTFIAVTAAARLGKLFGTRFGSKAELAGGIILILMGLKVLLEHMTA